MINNWFLPGEESLTLLKKVQYWEDNFCREKCFDLEMICFSLLQRFFMIIYAKLNISVPSPSRTTSRSFNALSWVSRETPIVFKSKYVNIFWYIASSLMIAHLSKNSQYITPSLVTSIDKFGFNTILMKRFYTILIIF